MDEPPTAQKVFVIASMGRCELVVKPHSKFWTVNIEEFLF